MRENNRRWGLKKEDVNLDGYEPVAHPVPFADPCAPRPNAAPANPDLDIQPPAVWFAADGTRFESLLVLGDGTAYGRRGPAPHRPQPTEADRFGSWRGVDAPSDELIEEAIKELEGATAPAGGIIGATLSTDRRTRTTSTATLTSYPTRTIGAYNATSAAGQTWCTATKVGPRHILTAAHCIIDENGNFTVTSGWFHPGQTNSTHPNTGGTAVWFSGGHYRWPYGGNSNRRWDYALMYLEDRLDSFQLGWMGMTWWTTAAGYTNKSVSLRGYPQKTGGSDAVRCQASVLTPKNCDGWMYGHSATLDGNAFRSDEQLEYNIDTTPAQSGSSIQVTVNGEIATAGVHWGCSGFGGCGSSRNRAARMRQSMWNDLCAWIGAVDSVHGSHSLCP